MSARRSIIVRSKNKPTAIFSDSNHMSTVVEYPRSTDVILREASAARMVLSTGRNPDVVAFEISVVSYFLDAADLLGVPKSLAALYGICFASPEPLSHTEIKARVDLSTGSVSQGIRFLTDIGAIADVSAASDRAALTAPDVQLRKFILHYLEKRVEKQLTAGECRIQDIRNTIPRHEPDAVKLLTSRVKALEGWHTKASAMLPLVRAGLKLS